MKSIEIKMEVRKWNHEVVQQKRFERGEKYLLDYFVVLWRSGFLIPCNSCKAIHVTSLRDAEKYIEDDERNPRRGLK